MDLSEKNLTAFFEALDDDFGDVGDFNNPYADKLRPIILIVIKKLKEVVPRAIFYPETIYVERSEKYSNPYYVASVEADNWLNKMKRTKVTFSIRESDYFTSNTTYERIDAPVFNIEAESGGAAGHFQMMIHPTRPKDDTVYTSGGFDSAVRDATAKAKAAQNGSQYNDMKMFYKALAEAGYTKGGVNKREKLQYVTVKKDIHEELQAFVLKMGWDKLGVQVTGQGFDAYLRIPYLVGDEDE